MAGSWKRSRSAGFGSRWRSRSLRGLLYVGGVSRRCARRRSLAQWAAALWLWAFLCTAIGAGPWLRSGRIRGEAYLSEGALPIYVLHHVPLILIAWRVKDLPWPIWQRYGLIVAGSLAVTLSDLSRAGAAL